MVLSSVFTGGLIERLFFAVSGGLAPIGRDSLFDQVCLMRSTRRSLEILVERLGSAGVGMRFNRELRIGIVIQILLESVSESGKREPPAADQADSRIPLVRTARGIQTLLERDCRNRLDAPDD